MGKSAQAKFDGYAPSKKYEKHEFFVSFVQQLHKLQAYGQGDVQLLRNYLFSLNVCSHFRSNWFRVHRPNKLDKHDKIRPGANTYTEQNETKTARPIYQQ